VSPKGTEWTTPCLNEDCGEIHPLKDCSNTTAEKKDELFKKLRSDRKKLSALGTSKITDGRWKVTIEDRIEGVALGDIGADVSAISYSTIRNLEQKGIDVSKTTLRSPVQLSVAVKIPGNAAVTAHSKVLLSIKLNLPCGPLRLRRVEFLVVDREMDEILLGRPLLKCLGFDLESHLEKVRLNFDNADVKGLMSQESHPSSSATVKLNRFAVYNGLRYDSVDDDPILMPQTPGANMGVDTEADIDLALKKKIREAKENGMSAVGLRTIEELLCEFKEIFRIKLGPDPPAKVEPLRIRLKPGHRPIRATQRRYAPQQRAFISSTIQRLQKIGAVFPNPKSRWASPALAVAKPGAEKFRFTVDLRAPNAMTEPVVSAMPNLESLLQTTGGSKVFSKIDLCHAYWQIPLHPDSQECMSIQTPLGVQTPRRVLQGGTDAGNHFQSCTAPLFEELSENLLQWLDDFLLHAKSEKELIEFLKEFFRTCRQFGLKLHAEKSQLFLRKANFCGRIIDGDGTRFDPRRLDTLLSMRKPEHAGDLQQFICATNWMRSSIPEYSTVIAPLHNLMESCYAVAKKRTKRAVRNISLTKLWGADHDSAFQQIKSFLAQSLKLAHPKQGYVTCLFSDASDTHWSSVLTQVPEQEMDRCVEDQNHEPLSFLSGAFSGASANWSIVEKEAFSIVESMTRLEYLIAGKEVSLFTDHANLTYIFDPVGQNPGIARHTANKLMRWALRLSGYRYVIEHLPGDRNVWADILTRWAVKPKTCVRALSLARLMVAPITPSNSEEFDWPKRSEIKSVQILSKKDAPNRFKEVNGILQDSNGVFWIPPDSEDMLKLRIIIACHTGIGGHRGIRSSTKALESHFYWEGAAEDVKAFCTSCLHCLSTSTGGVVPRPLGHAIHASKPNELLHFDYCYIGRSSSGPTYVLILKDDFSSYVWLKPCTAANAETTAMCLMEWFSTFGTVIQWVSDRGSHFKNEVIQELRERLHCTHHFTLAYCPWSNGSVEVVCRELIRTMRALVSEFQIPFKQWPTVLPIIQAVLNNTLLDRLGGICPLSAFTTLPADSPLLTIKNGQVGTVKLASIDEARARQITEIGRVQKSLEEFHRRISGLTSASRKKRVDAHNARTHVRPCNFDVGDYVLCGVRQRNIKRKLSLHWRGPRRIVRLLSDFLFETEDLRTLKKVVVHGSRLKFFRNSDYNVTEECLNQLAYQEGELCVVEELMDIRVHNGVVEILVKWKGFEEEDPGWELFDTMKEDIPALVSDFLIELKNSGTARQRRIANTLN